MYLVKIKRENDKFSKRRWFAYGEDKETGEKFVHGYRTLAEATLKNSQHQIIEVASQRSIMRNMKYSYEENN